MADITVQVSSPGTLTTWGYSSWGLNSWGQITGIELQIGEESILNEQNALFTASTNLLTLTITSLTITGDSNLSLSTNLLNTTVGFTSENVNANTIVQVTAPGDLSWGAEVWGAGSWGNVRA